MKYIRTVLASASPRRKEILNLIGIYPKIVIADLDEIVKKGENSESFIERIAKEKALRINPEEYYGSLIISADTVVLLRDKIIGKPSGREEAFDMLKELSDNTHTVLTGVNLIYKNSSRFILTKTKVMFNKLDEIEIEYYLNNEKYLDKAGAYAIQGLASIFVKGIEGCFFNVMGFPINSFYSLIKELGISIQQISKE